MIHLRIRVTYTKTHLDTRLTPFRSYRQRCEQEICQDDAGTRTIWLSCYVHVACKCAQIACTLLWVRVCARVWLNFCPASRTASAPQAFSSSLSNFAAVLLSSRTVHHCKVQLPSHLAQVVLTLKQAEPKDSGTETSPDVKLNCGSLSLRFLPPWLPWHPRQRGDKFGTPSPAYTASGESLRSYLLYHLHCRTAVDCCLTSTLLWKWGRGE